MPARQTSRPSSCNRAAHSLAHQLPLRPRVVRRHGRGRGREHRQRVQQQLQLDAELVTVLSAALEAREELLAGGAGRSGLVRGRRACSVAR